MPSWSVLKNGEIKTLLVMHAQQHLTLRRRVGPVRRSLQRLITRDHGDGMSALSIAEKGKEKTTGENPAGQGIGRLLCGANGEVQQRCNSPKGASRIERLMCL